MNDPVDWERYGFLGGIIVGATWVLSKITSFFKREESVQHKTNLDDVLNAMTELKSSMSIIDAQLELFRQEQNRFHQEQNRVHAAIELQLRDTLNYNRRKES